MIRITPAKAAEKSIFQQNLCSQFPLKPSLEFSWLGTRTRARQYSARGTVENTSYRPRYDL